MRDRSSVIHPSRNGIAWALSGLVLFVVAETILNLAGEEPYWISAGCLTILLVVAGWAIGYYRTPFDTSLRALTAMSAIVDKDEHVDAWTRRLFSFIPWPILFAGAVEALWIATLIALEPAFTAHWLNLGVVVFFTPIVVVGAWGSFIAVGAVWAVVQTANSGLIAPFSVVRDPVVGRIERGWRSAGFFIVVVYLMLLIAFVKGPYPLDGYLLPWLIAFAIFPLLWWLVGGVQLHRMLTDLKGANVAVARADVARLADALTHDSSDVTLQELNAALDIEAKEEAKPACPSAPGGHASFALAVIPIAIQSSLIYAGVADGL
jgi:hypothetical protein